MNTSLFQIERDSQANWLVRNTETNIVIGTHWSHEAAVQQIAFVESRIARAAQRKQALYIYA